MRMQRSLQARTLSCWLMAASRGLDAAAAGELTIRSLSPTWIWLKAAKLCASILSTVNCGATADQRRVTEQLTGQQREDRTKKQDILRKHHR